MLDLVAEGEAVFYVGCGVGRFIHGLNRAGVGAVGFELDEAAPAAVSARSVDIWSELENIPEELQVEVRLVKIFHVLIHPQYPGAFLQGILESLLNMKLLVVKIP